MSTPTDVTTDTTVVPDATVDAAVEDTTTYPTADATSMEVPTVEGNLTVFLADNNITERQLYDIVVARLQETDDSIYLDGTRKLANWEIVLIVLGVILIVFIAIAVYRRQRTSVTLQAADAAIRSSFYDNIPPNMMIRPYLSSNDLPKTPRAMPSARPFGMPRGVGLPGPRGPFGTDS